MSRESFMRRALACAEKAKALGEVPVGAVVVKDGKIIATGYNRREKGKNALLHAEIIAIQRACKRVGDWRLSDCDLYVTLEPCPMCTGAIINARIRRVYFGARDPKAGCMGSLCDLTSLPFNHQPEVIQGVLEQECSGQLTDFFRQVRVEKTPEQKILSLRPFSQEDLPVLKQYLFSHRSVKSVSAIIDQWKEDKKSEHFALSVDERAVGYGRLTKKEETAEIEVSIFSDFRGKTYGKQAVEQLLSVAKNRGYSSVVATVRKNSVPACRLCSSVGFVRAGETVTAKGQELWNLTYSFLD
ncbi:MAG: tRNA adenosine(34) deaminase TadA [Clostridia bacterium]|nr:tRNA adenosine(34) deaminase TadA [Clostridia bacterium]